MASILQEKNSIKSIIKDRLSKEEREKLMDDLMIKTRATFNDYLDNPLKFSNAERVYIKNFINAKLKLKINLKDFS